MTGVKITKLTVDERLTEHAACVGKTDIMYAPPPARGDTRAVRIANRAALAICADCTVTDECRAVWEQLPATQQAFGVWFGTTPSMRGQGRSCELAGCANELTHRQVIRSIQYCSPRCSHEAQRRRHRGITA